MLPLRPIWEQEGTTALLCSAPYPAKEFPLTASPSSPETARDALRRATRNAHAIVDEAFGRFDLGEAASYREFLTAHARIVPAVEAWLDAHQPEDMQEWSLVRRTPGILADLAELEVEAPETVAFDPPHDAATACGVTYVMEGSRLGGTFLSRQIGPDLPKAYLGAPSQSALWRDFLANLDRHLPTADAVERACKAALDTFDVFRRAGAATVRP
ncbi:MAG: biliverdin-producing heme oxygenase [Sphingobium sp.]